MSETATAPSAAASERLDAWIEETVARAPELTPAGHDQLRELLRPARPSAGAA